MEEAVPELTVRTPGEFRGLCFEAARRTGGHVARWSVPKVTPNYHEVHLEHADHRGTIVVLWTAEGDVALTASVEPLPPIEFVDDAALMAVLAELSSDIRVWAKAELEKPFKAADWPDLDPRDVRYWRPERVGDVLFNWWD
ncbi:hypothetical protein [Lentzea nigeriaca]|uniref:hypothetical protein n=1 Tax=Lentzea nigeriaca TaxID=1128665 RepID=UPI00195C6D0D|nr:hypothetical protein [Lentzea nigeriaca]MBM7861079.1 hypothetical protein [Lentzea nigeriaca]